MVELGGGKSLSSTRSAPRLADVIGQADLKEALLAVGANEALDGLLIQGEKGTGKSTAVRALAELLPPQTVVADCPYGCPPADGGGPHGSAVRCTDCRERDDPPVAERPVPLVTVPLGATRERVVGSLSVADALDGEPEFDPGLLARAHRGILYVDEVNLLEDHLVDVLLDAAASGVNRVERDGVSVAHPASFTLIGTMNPEEGDLRPQLRDRFALRTAVTGCADTADRVAIIEQALDRDGESASPEARGIASGENGGATARDSAAPADRIERARELLDGVILPDALAERIAETCRDAGVDGHRGDIATARAARSLAALDGRGTVSERDVRRGLELALPHRLRSQPFEEARDPDSVIDEHFDASGAAESEDRAEDRETTDRETDTGDDPGNGEEGADGSNGSDRRSGDGSAGSDDDRDTSTEESDPRDDGTPSGTDAADPGGPSGSGDRSQPPPGTRRGNGDGATAGATAGAGEGDRSDDRANPSAESETGDETAQATPRIPGERTAAVGEARAPAVGAPAPDGDHATGAGGTFGDRATEGGSGTAVRAVRPDQGGDAAASIDAGATVRATAKRGGDAVESRDLRQSVRRDRVATLVTFVVDASASMRPAMRTAKATVMALLEDAYEDRDTVAVVTFAGDGADVLLPPTNSVTLAARHLKDLPHGDRTPLPAGLETAGDVIERADPDASLVVLVTDGKANVAAESPVTATRQAARRLAAIDADVLVVDASDDGTRSGLTTMVARETDGDRVPIDALSADRVAAAANQSQG